MLLVLTMARPSVRSASVRSEVSRARNRARSHTRRRRGVWTDRSVEDGEATGIDGIEGRVGPVRVVEHQPELRLVVDHGQHLPVALAFGLKGSLLPSSQRAGRWIEANRR